MNMRFDPLQPMVVLGHAKGVEARQQNNHK
jgi:hypothetical protein